MFKMMLKTPNDLMATVIRITVGIVMFPHGAQKMLGWFGGSGFSGTLQGFQQMMGIPSFVTVLVIFVEFFGALALIIGLMGRLAALGIGTIMVVAVMMVHGKNGFFINWYGAAEGGEGFEYHLLVIGCCLALLLRGSGAMSMDRLLMEKDK